MFGNISLVIVMLENSYVKNKANMNVVYKCLFYPTVLEAVLGYYFGIKKTNEEIPLINV